MFPLHQKAAARKDSQSKFGEFGPIQRLITVTIGQAVCLRIMSELTSTSMTWSPPYSSAAGLSSPVEAAPFPAATSRVTSAGGSAAGSTSHTHFHGDGALTLAGLPRTIGFTLDAFTANPRSLQVSVTDINNPLDEISDIKSAANSAKVDVRFLFTAIMQESVGYVRARTTPNYTPNPSNMNSFDGTSCF